MIDLLLASQSPRRRELLQQIGVRFSSITPNVPEQAQPGEAPEAYVQRLAQAKSAAGAALHHGIPSLGADTIVVLGDQILEKPSDKEQALSMLAALSGRTHQVITAVTVTLQANADDVPARSASRLCRSEVRLRRIPPSEAERYWQTGEPKDKAGAYGIQGFGAVFVEHLNGSYSNVVGLPLAETAQLLQEFRIPFWSQEL